MRSMEQKSNKNKIIHKERGNRKKSYMLGLAIAFLGISGIIMGASFAHADTYNNYSNAQVYGANIFGTHMAWVNENWNPFATYTNGNFQNNINTQLVLNTGANWPDSASIKGANSWENSTTLSSTVDYSLNDPFGEHLTGTITNDVVYNGNGDYQYYIQVYGTVCYTEENPLFLPIEIGFEFGE